jgi:hypothetical protein
MLAGIAIRTQLVGVLAVLLSCSSCRERQDSNRFAGEWRIRLESDGTRPRNAVTAQTPITGAFVFGRAVTDYGNTGPLKLPKGSSVGRAYLSVDARQPVSRGDEGIPFSRNPDADLLEEVIAIPVDSPKVILAFAPKFSDYGLDLQGRISGDTVRGRWRFWPGRDTLASGTFTMWRVPRSWVTDSAIARSRRGARRWESGK